MKAQLSSLLISLSVCSSSWAEVFVAPFGGYSIGSDGINLARYDDGAAQLKDSVHGGIMLGLAQRGYGDVYLFYSRQQTDLLLQRDVAPPEEMTLEYWHLAGTLYFSEGDVRPYVASSIGLTRFAADAARGSTNKFSLGLATGLNYQLAHNLALFTELRGFATFFGDDSGIACRRDEQCTWYISRDTFWQGQANLGLQFRF
ncbi:outer membrane beta-barrel protein [Shewanella sp. C32]|uniref:Outer membrane beta-barrel protein n=1 Tax=Shewanella electrica TaxID=515560 RepID=A0ABT2FIN4_9GAMM|nr:outer membrane beta-barrel protein [Shewanella electrica]MCH1924291.1 outer membrane beta-barrel protein [Shewanella electrica]MCS4556194.1 outer membrane beta-barrel protein [Shewanella electrica]